MTPAGYSDGMEQVTKRIYLSGSLSPAQWDDEVVTGVVELGLPVLFLPHAAPEVLVMPADKDFGMISWMLARGQLGSCPDEGTDMLERQDFAACEQLLRSRLRHFPATYEYFIQKTVWDLITICARIVRFAGLHSSTLEDCIRVHVDLTLMCVRALTLGVESLTYHCHAFQLRAPPSHAWQVHQRIFKIS